MEPPKRVPLLPGGTSKPKEEAETYCFQLKLPESNDTVYPEYSWKDLIRDDEKKRTREKNIATTGRVLDPYASDDEDALKAMAAKFEEKYNNNPTASSSPVGKARKRKRQAEDYIDKGAGYDETDSFIDNTDIYDEVVPEDCQTAYGGFYINSGALEFKEAEVSEGEDIKVENPVQKILSKPQLKQEISTGNAATPPILQAAKCKIRNDNSDPPKKRRDSTSSQIKKARRKSITDTMNLKKVHSSSPENILKIKHEDDVEKVKEKGSKNNPMVISSSSSSGTSSSEDDSSSSGSESSEDGVTKKNKLIKATIFRKSAAIVSANAIANNPNKPTPLNPNPQRRLKVKNVPLNPKLHGGINPVVPTPATVTPMSNRDIFSSSASSVKGLSSLPLGLTVTPNTLPPKSSPSLGGMNIGLGLDLKSKSSSGISVNPIISKVSPPKRQRPPKLNSKLSSSTQPPNKLPKIQKTSPIQQHHQPTPSQLANQAKYANSLMTSYQNYQLQSASLAALVNIRPPFAPEAKKKARNLNKNKANSNNNRNNNIVPPGGTYGGGPSSQLGTAITVTEVKEKNSNRHSLPAVNSAFNNKSLNLSGGKFSGSSGNNSPVNMTRLPGSITITNSSNSPVLNLSTSTSSIQAHHSKGGALNLTPNSRKNYKVTPHDVNSLLNYSANVNSILANNQNSTQHSLEKLFANGVPIGRDSQKNK